jgi:nicotinamide-nucleotide amidase
MAGADIAVAVSGVEGPSGGSEQKPVGMVWFAWTVRDGSKLRSTTSCEHFAGDRDLVRELTVVHALQGVRERIA